MIGKPIVLVNRTSRILTFTKDGREFRIEPGRNPGFTSDQVRFAKVQNPLYGSEDYNSRTFESLVGVEGTKDPIDPIPDEILAQAEQIGERYDRSTFIDPRLRNVSRERARYIPNRDAVATMAGANAMATGSED